MNTSHNRNCKLTIEQVRAEQEQLVKKYGWYAHVIEDDTSVATGFNYHTHGFDESLRHLDIQIVLPGNPAKGGNLRHHNLCHRIAKEIFGQIKQGKKFQDGEETTISREGGSPYSVRFIKVHEGDRNVLRVILPDLRGGLEPKHVAEGDKPEYALQWSV